ncbi:hypothetical protein NDU88_000339 [Pleurodeles waltl]|uniref:Uncharacterized protein n=1 Tax=Pleurodeles waltl TaxID=8319 RepID=A0AAV7U540_PLEWA|nr:hypothetical protein NDU88_000339 [Pleurodeles waltl]
MASGRCNWAVTATDTKRTPEPAEECPGGTLWNAEHPEVFHNPNIRVEDARTPQEQEPEENEEEKPERGEKAEPEEKGHAKPEEGGGNRAQRRSINRNIEKPKETN